jgi:hypothetical protein
MIILGVILILVGYFLHFDHSNLVFDLGWILLIIGVVLFLLGRFGHPVRGRKHYY